MNENKKINFCKDRIRETLAKFPNNSLPIFFLPADLMGSFVTASKEMMPELIARQIIPILIANEDYLAQSSMGATHMFFTLTFLAETLSKTSRRQPQEILEQATKLAGQVLSGMSREQIFEHCQKYGLDLSGD